ncbi:MAG TPA: hypothetical protein VFP28_00375 [Gemmatimonadales bacterium]|nr:hypothetical protein [Gemmatimonadales bacterium]
MTLGGRYLAAVGVVAAGGLALGGLVSADERAAVWWGVGVGVVLQTPLGWWAIQSIGTERFMAVWALGMLVRLTAVVLAGLIVQPALGPRTGAMLGGMVGVLVALLAVEGAMAFREHSREDRR